MVSTAHSCSAEVTVLAVKAEGQLGGSHLLFMTQSVLAYFCLISHLAESYWFTVIAPCWWLQLHRLTYHKGNLKNIYFVLLPFFPSNECLALCGQAVISMLSFVLVWKRNRSAEQTEQK